MAVARSSPIELNDKLSDTNTLLARSMVATAIAPCRSMPLATHRVFAKCNVFAADPVPERCLLYYRVHCWTSLRLVKYCSSYSQSVVAVTLHPSR